ncbi:hypothetical protein SY89_02489 [Halolamina pelagica]|uniref:Uncharacterized protein n=1 Tax=Halolamina pelagica TaxID=699431 RepID=A0A0P7HXB8_9EURY|nr:hypothetical protein SY89_02489 [Halolamina pelagica]
MTMSLGAVSPAPIGAGVFEASSSLNSPNGLSFVPTKATSPAISAASCSRPSSTCSTARVMSVLRLMRTSAVPWSPRRML